MPAEELLHQFVVGLGDSLAHSLDKALEAVADVGQIDLHLLAAPVLEGLLAEQIDVQGCRRRASPDEGQTVEPNFIFMSARILK